MSKGLLILLPVFLLAGCNNNNGVPNGVMPPPKMQAVLWDMMRADQFLADYVINKDTSANKKTETLKYYQQIFAIHKIDEEDFQQSFSYYKSHPALLKAIMDSISKPAPELLTPPLATDTPALAPTPVLDSTVKTVDTSAPVKRIRPLPVN
jgi:hypothetical protein